MFVTLSARSEYLTSQHFDYHCLKAIVVCFDSDQDLFDFELIDLLHFSPRSLSEHRFNEIGHERIEPGIAKYLFKTSEILVRLPGWQLP